MTTPPGAPPAIERVLGRRRFKDPPDLQELVRRFGGYANITAEGWAEYNEAKRQWEEDRLHGRLAAQDRPRPAPRLPDQGSRWRVLRNSNAHEFRDPSASPERPNPSKSEKPTGTENPDFSSDLLVELNRLQEGLRGGAKRAVGGQGPTFAGSGL